MDCNTTLRAKHFLFDRIKSDKPEPPKKDKRSITEKDITICIPVLNNYSGLQKLIASIEQGTVLPDYYCIFDNGRKYNNRISNDRIYTVVPDGQVSVGKAWNWFIDNVSEIRIISNDDIVFNRDTLEKFLEKMSNETISYPSGMGKNSFSCFSLPDSVVTKVGKFDEEFYPAYYEDTSYNYRMSLLGLKPEEISECKLIHNANQTLTYFDRNQLAAHHNNFNRNENLYVRMWGGLAGHERYTVKYNGKRG